MVEPEQSSSAQQHGDLGTYLRVLRRNGPFILLVTVGLALAGYLLAFNRESRFRASADVFLASQALATSLGAVEQVSAEPERAVATQARLARLPIIAQRTLEKTGEVRPGTAQAVKVSDFLNRSTVDTDPLADILTFSVTDESPELATRAATAYARAYTEYRHLLDTRAVMKARRSVEQQVEELRGAGARRTPLYRRLTTRLAQLQSDEALLGSRATVVRQAGVPEKVQPKPKRTAVLSGFLGLVLAVVLVSLRETLSPRLRSTQDLEERLELPLLATIPKFERGNHDAVVVLANPHSSSAEAFQLLATNVDFANVDRGAVTIMVGSARRGEGKSAIAANLAASFARRNRHVVLVDLDLREPGLARMFGIEDRPGLTNVILGEADLEAALADIPIGRGKDLLGSSTNGPTPMTGHEAPDGRLEVLTSGPVPAAVPELMASHRLTELLARVSERADIVLVDSSPLLEVSDAVALSAKVDAMLLVVHLTSVTASVTDELRRVLDGLPVLSLGVVAIDVRSVKQRYGYGREIGQRRRGSGEATTPDEPARSSATVRGS